MFTKEEWLPSQLSIARHYGGVKINGVEYMVVDRLGRKFFFHSIADSVPADLIDRRFISLYKKHGRDKFIRVLKECPGTESVKEMKALLESL
jgi:hypothetical protein